MHKNGHKNKQPKQRHKHVVLWHENAALPLVFDQITSFHKHSIYSINVEKQGYLTFCATLINMIILRNPAQFGSFDKKPGEELA